MIRPLLLGFSWLVLFSCNNTQEKTSANADTTSARDILAPLQVTMLADLPDSLQPKTIRLENMPTPLTVSVGIGKGIRTAFGFGNKDATTIALRPPVPVLPPVLRDGNGDMITDKDGNPFILGDGGISDFTTYTTDNGLALDAVGASYTDHLGNLWFGTQGGGVSRYDGHTFTTFSTAQGLAFPAVRSIAEDHAGNLWFGTQGGGVTRYDGHRFTTFSTAQGLAHNVVRSITADDKGNLWFGTQGGGVSRYDGHTFTTFSTAQGLAHNTVLSSTADRAGNLWFGTQGGGVSRYDGKSFTTFTTAQGLPDNDVASITADHTGTLWFGTQGGGVSRYDGKSFTTFSTAQGLAHNAVYSSTVDHAGTLWFGTVGGGISRYDGKTLSTFTTAQGLADNTVLSITADHAGNVWFGTYGGGVSRYNGKTFTTFTTAQGLPNNVVKSITADRAGTLWFGTAGGGVSRYDGKRFTTFSTAQGLAYDDVSSITADRAGTLWFGTQGGGVSRYDGHTFTTFTTAQGLPNNTVKSITADRAGTLWFGTDGGGVSRYDGKSFTTFSTAQGLADNMVLSITADHAGNLWIGTDHGLSLLSAEAQERLSHAYHATGTGAVRIAVPLFKTFTTVDGLPDDFVLQIVEDSVGTLYVGTNVGIARLTGRGSNWKVDRVFNASTGHPVKDANEGSPAMFKDRTGAIWLGTGSEKTALVRFDPKAVPENNAPPTVIIHSIRLDNAAISWYSLVHKARAHQSFTARSDSSTIAQQEMMTLGKVFSAPERDSVRQVYAGVTFDSIPAFYPIPAHLILPYRHNSVRFDFAALETGANKTVRYQYILDGYGNEWSPITEQTSAIFGNIGEGTYTFKLKARSPEGVWSAPVSYTFTVLPPWHRTWWAYSLYALTCFFALRVFIAWRERTLRMDKERLEHTVDLRTAEVVAEKKKSDDLLLNILPEEVAQELKTNGRADARQFDQVTVMFTDFRGFTQISETLTPSELVDELHTCFEAFDHITAKYNIEKIKTIGDAYMCAGGLPVSNTTHAVDVVHAALEMQHFMQQHVQQQQRENRPRFDMRIGVHTGPVVAGIVGVRKFAYDIWGDTVNIASRMESSGETGKVNISGSTFALVKDQFQCVHRGRIQAKNKGEIDMYFVENTR